MGKLRGLLFVEGEKGKKGADKKGHSSAYMFRGGRKKGGGGRFTPTMAGWV